jgi:hypothetical protein
MLRVMTSANRKEVLICVRVRGACGIAGVQVNAAERRAALTSNQHSLETTERTEDTED